MGSKVKVGFSLERELLEMIDAIIEASRYLEPSQSEVVEAILAAFFKSPINHTEKARELIIKRRNGML
jgi:metal-responsive CopG/Arc/MetJ family transcriptional regulator